MPRLESFALRSAKPPLKPSLAGFAFGVLGEISAVGLTVLSMWLIVRAGEQPPILFLTFAIVGVRAFALSRAALRYLERLKTHDIVLAQLASLRAQSFKKLVPLVPGAIAETSDGEVLARLVDDIDQLQDQHLRVLHPLVVSGTTISLTLIVLFLISPPAALVTLIALLLALALSFLISERVAKNANLTLASLRAKLVELLIERFDNALVLGVFGAAQAVDNQIDQTVAALNRAQLKTSGSIKGALALLSFFAGLATVAIIAIFVMHAGAPTSAPLLAAVIIAPTAVFEVASVMPAIMQARLRVQKSAERLDELLDSALPPEIPAETPVEPVGTASSVSVTPVSVNPVSASSEILGATAWRNDGPLAEPLIAVKDLSVSYPGATSPAIKNISFELHRGQTLIVAGESGAGKSTLALALVRFLAYSGSFKLRGKEASELAPSEVRAVIGLSEQRPHLFESSVRQNLKFAKPDASDAELIEVLERVKLQGWISERDGLDTLVGERGALVSGGQAQRIALARVLLADFPVIVLDEPTAGVDGLMSKQILADLFAAVPKDKALILITHKELPFGYESLPMLKI